MAAKKRGAATQEGMESIGARVARFRKERGVNQVELAERLGVSQSIVSDYERGTLRLHGELIVKLAGLLHVTTDELLGLKAPVPRPRKLAGAGSRRLWRTFQLVEQLPERDQRAVVRLIHSLAGGRVAE